MDKYDKGEKIGEGQYGVVYLGKEKETGRPVAIKKLRASVGNEGLEFTALREVKILTEIKHKNVVELLAVIPHKLNINLVFEYMKTDVEELIKSRTIVLKENMIKSIMKMTLEGVLALHSSFILHRDLKPGNLLISPTGEVKLGDFGLAKMFAEPNTTMTPVVITRWYRPPELLFGARAYGTAVDMWSVGCIFAELMLRTPYFAGDSDLDQLSKIFAALGTPTPEEWPGMTELPQYMAFEEFPRTPFKVLFTAASDEALDLLDKLLKYDPLQRITAKEALAHPYFSTVPLPCPPSEIPIPK